MPLARPNNSPSPLANANGHDEVAIGLLAFLMGFYHLLEVEVTDDRAVKEEKRIVMVQNLHRIQFAKSVTSGLSRLRRQALNLQLVPVW
jgi:hypothetical protein